MRRNSEVESQHDRGMASMAHQTASRRASVGGGRKSKEQWHDQDLGNISLGRFPVPATAMRSHPFRDPSILSHVPETEMDMMISNNYAHSVYLNSGSEPAERD
jgi:hypothetical protein